MPSMDKWAPRGFLAPRDPSKDFGKKNGIVWNWPRFLYFGGRPGAPKQAGTGVPRLMLEDESQRAVAPISDRGKGR